MMAAIRTSCFDPRKGVTAVRTLSFTLVGLLVTCVVAFADQQETRAAPEIRPMLGAYLPTGKQGNDLKSAMLAGVQVATELQSSLHLVGSFQWSPSKNKYL